LGKPLQTKSQPLPPAAAQPSSSSPFLMFTEEEERTLSAGVRLKEVGPMSMGLSMRIRLLGVALRIEAAFLASRAKRVAEWKATRYTLLQSEQTCGQFTLAPPLTTRETQTLDALRLAFEHVFAGMKPHMCLLMGPLMRHMLSPNEYPAPTEGFWPACNRLAAYAEDMLRVTTTTPSSDDGGGGGGGAPREYYYCFTPLRHARQVEGMRLERLRHPWWNFVQWYKRHPTAELKQPELYGSLQQITHTGRFVVRFVYDTRADGIPKVPHVVVFYPLDGSSHEQFWIYGALLSSPAAATPKSELERLKQRVEALEDKE
jgi:hypothetical protein